MTSGSWLFRIMTKVCIEMRNPAHERDRPGTGDQYLDARFFIFAFRVPWPVERVDRSKLCFGEAITWSSG